MTTPVVLHESLPLEDHLDRRFNTYLLDTPHAYLVVLGNRFIMEKAAQYPGRGLYWAYGGSRAAKFDPRLDIKTVNARFEQARVNKAVDLLSDPAVLRAMQSGQILAAYESDIKQCSNNASRPPALDMLVDTAGYTRADISAQAPLQPIPAGTQLSFTNRLRQAAVGGGRVIILPKTAEVYEIITDPKHPDFEKVVDSILEVQGKFLNGEDVNAFRINRRGHILETHATIEPGAIKNTPDFGHMKEVADMLLKHTPHTLGVRLESGGGGGKARYSADTVLTALHTCIEEQACAGVTNIDLQRTPVTTIGSAGALGSYAVAYLKEHGYRNVQICDLLYDAEHMVRVENRSQLEELPGVRSVKELENGRYLLTWADDKETSEIETGVGEKLVPIKKRGGYQSIPQEWRVIAAEEGRFTDEALKNGGMGKAGILIATTIGRELENSNYTLIPPGTLFLVAHNNSFPPMAAGTRLARELQNNGVLAFPGQILTYGGSFNSVIEWYSREAGNEVFPKPFAHAVIIESSKALIRGILGHIRQQGAKRGRDVPGTPLEIFTEEFVGLPLYRDVISPVSQLSEVGSE